MDIQSLTTAVAAVAPIDGVAVPDPADKATWRIDFQPAATPQQQAAAQAVVQSWVDPPPPTAGDQAAASAARDPFQRAIVKLLAAQSVQIFGQARTVPQVIAILKALA